MPIPTTLADLSTVESVNSPAGSDNVGGNIDNYFRAHATILKRQFAQGADLASATTLAVPADGTCFNVTGTTTIAQIADQWKGKIVVLRFTDVVTLTHSASLVMPYAESVTTAADDVAIFVNIDTNIWQCLDYPNYSYRKTMAAADNAQATANGAVKEDGSTTMTGALAVTDGTNTASYPASGVPYGPSWGASGAKTYIDTALATKQAALGYVPVQQGGGPGQGGSTINIGYGASNEGVRVAVSGFDQGVILFEDNLASKLASMAVDAIGAYGFFQNNTGVTLGAGNGTSGSGITWSSASHSSSSNPAGNWMCCGYAPNGDKTLFRRVS